MDSSARGATVPLGSRLNFSEMFRELQMRKDMREDRREVKREDKGEDRRQTATSSQQTERTGGEEERQEPQEVWG